MMRRFAPAPSAPEPTVTAAQSDILPTARPALIARPVTGAVAAHRLPPSMPERRRLIADRDIARAMRRNLWCHFLRPAGHAAAQAQRGARAAPLGSPAYRRHCAAWRRRRRDIAFYLAAWTAQRAIERHLTARIAALADALAPRP